MRQCNYIPRCQFTVTARGEFAAHSHVRHVAHRDDDVYPNRPSNIPDGGDQHHSGGKSTDIFTMWLWR